MKKVACLLLAMLLLSSCLGACSGAVGEGGTVLKPLETTEAGGITPIDPDNVGGSMDFTTPQFNTDINVEVITGGGSTISFSIPKDMAELDMEDFDLQQFLEDTQINFSNEDMATLEEMDPTQVKELAQTMQNLLSDLSLALESAGLSVRVDGATGQITLDATVLFEPEEAAVSEEGKQLLQKFMQAYAFVVFNEKYAGFVSKVLIEGHTDTDGGYDYNLQLSQDRADNVLAYALSEDCGIPEVYRQQLKDTAEAKGYAYDDPVYTEDGQVDMAASRRVTFRFMINLDR